MSGQRQAVLREPQLRGALGFADEQRARSTTRWPALSQTLTLRWRRAVEPAAGSCASTRPAAIFGSGRRLSSTFSVSPRSAGERGRFVGGAIGQIGNL